MKEKTKQKIRKVLRISFWCCMVIGLGISLGFSDRQQSIAPCTGLDITIRADSDNFFIQQSDVKQMLLDRGDSIINQPASSINIPELEYVLNSHAAVAHAEVYMTVEGKMKIDIEQRKPLLRIINCDGEGYYIDETGTLMPLSDKFTSRVLIVSGRLFEPYSKRYMYSMDEIEKNPNVKDRTWLDDLFRLAQFIEKDEFWSAQVQQMVINSDNDIELVPRIGDQRIIFGDAQDMELKFDKLMKFYLKGLNTTGWWDSYSIINLKFKNQIVCTKKS